MRSDDVVRFYIAGVKPSAIARQSRIEGDGLTVAEVIEILAARGYKRRRTEARRNPALPAEARP
jgi:hypothetical protein